MNFDLVVQNGLVLDGTGNPWYRSDIGITEGKIVKIGYKLIKTDKIINATNLIVSPGFIDLHSHSDFALPFDNYLESSIRQGITTSVVGNCGDSLAPIINEKKEEMTKLLGAFSPPGEELQITWETFEEYLQELEKRRCSMNLATLVGFGTVRMIGGPGLEDRIPHNEELQQMKLLIDEAMIAGAFGMSTGLLYPPQIYAKTEEIVELAKIVANHNGLYFSHIRNEGAGVLDAIEELIEIVTQSGCRGGQIGHHKIAFPVNWGKSKESLKLIDEANNHGLNINCDQYPYNRGMTSLITVLPPWVHIGGIELILERLQNSEDKERIKRDFNQGIEGWENFFGKDLGPERIFISSVKSVTLKSIEGKNISEITKLMNKSDDFTTLCDIILEDKGETTMTIDSMGEEDIHRIMKNKYTAISTDGWGVTVGGKLDFGKPHPRFFGTYPRILGKFVREERLLSLEDAIRKMTSFPAQILGIRGRGLIQEGSWADLVLFDAQTIIDTATYENPVQLPTGIKYVLVNGEMVVKEEKMTRKLPGVVLRHRLSIVDKSIG
jgi:N-acyl-D-amino-acid deacylase